MQASLTTRANRVDERIDAAGPDATATPPVRKMVNAMREGGFRANISLSAGAFVCNHLMYGVLHFLAQQHLPVQAGFVHLPYLPEQVEGKEDVPCMPLEDMVRAIGLGITVLAAADSN